jgi:hypothetical protein
MTTDLKVVSLYESNSRDPVATLRIIAGEIEAGKYGAVGSVGLVVMGDTVEVFGMGDDATGPSIASLLYAGFLRLMKPIVEHGR